MYNPYRRRGEWLECDVCKTPHRRILPADLIQYVNPDGTMVVLTEEESTRCFTCTPLPLPYSHTCSKCNHTTRGECLYHVDAIPNTCAECGYCPDDDLPSYGGHFEKRPTLTGEGRELFNRIKKRNIGSNMPDY